MKLAPPSERPLEIRSTQPLGRVQCPVPVASHW